MTAIIIGIGISLILYWCYSSIKKSKQITEKRDQLNEAKIKSEAINIEQEIVLEREYQKDVEKQINNIKGT